jgi:hypothetical protein
MLVLIDDLPSPSRFSLTAMLVSLVFRLSFACRSFTAFIKPDLQNEDKAQSRGSSAKV